MRVVRKIDEFRPPAAGCALTVGNFDGVHPGHRKIMEEVVARARASGRLAVAVTFDPHPAKVLPNHTPPRLITTLEKRLQLLEATGLDSTVVLPFTMELARLSPREFIERIAIVRLGMKAVCVGENFRFGYQQAGDVARLRELGRELGFSVCVVETLSVRGEVVSSTRIRHYVAEGKVSRAGRLLGRWFAVSGQVQPGTGLGRKLVVPTLNMAYEQELVPKRGVYVTETTVCGRTYRSATNVGYRPTFDHSTLVIESHLLDFSEKISEGEIVVHFLHRLRDEMKFPSPDALRTQVLADIERTRQFFQRLDAGRDQHEPRKSR